MGINKVTRRCAAWIASLAILFAALAPTIAHAVLTSPGQSWAEVCSVSGARMVQVSGDQGGVADPLSKQSLHVEHCPFCATHAGTLALLGGVGSLSFAPLETPQRQPSLFLQAPRPLPIWTSAQSRAPPARA